MIKIRKYKKIFFLMLIAAVMWFHTLPLSAANRASAQNMQDGIYSIDVQLEGGSGRASVLSPAILTVENGSMKVRVEWSSSSYDYMMVENQKYLPLSKEEHSVFEIPVASLEQPLQVVADTTAMSTPHEIEYTLTFSQDSIESTDGGQTDKTEKQTEPEKEQKSASEKENISTELIYDHSMELEYAKEFSADYYKNGSILLTIAESDRYLLISEEQEIPEDLAKDVVVIKTPVKDTYLAASAVMDMFVSIDAMSQVKFSALKTDAWYIPEAKEAMELGKIQYAGKYSAPDYEQILAAGCDLAVENTMIYHTPEVKEQLENFDIPVLVDYSSYEKEPLGRTEWVKIYGLLTGHEKEAEEAFAREVSAFETVSEKQNTDKTVAFFYITTNGEVNVRKSSDYLPRMIELAGGKYVFQNLGGESGNSSTITMQMEEFYASAKDVDYLVYNSTIDGELESIEQMTDKNKLLKKFKAVDQNQVFCTTKNLYQSSMELGTIISDLHNMLTGDIEHMTYIYQLE